MIKQYFIKLPDLKVTLMILFYLVARYQTRKKKSSLISFLLVATSPLGLVLSQAFTAG